MQNDVVHSVLHTLMRILDLFVFVCADEKPFGQEANTL
jgi:hypothetical protein